MPDDAPDFSNQALAIEDLPDFSDQSISATEFVGPPTETQTEKGQRLRTELAQVRQEPAALSDPNAPAPTPVSTFQGASETTLMPAGEEYRHFRLPRAGAPGIQPVTTFQGPSEVTLQPEQQARTTGEVMQNAAAAGVEGIVNPMTPPIILGTVAAPEIVIPAFTAQMAKSGSIKLADALVDLQQGRHEEGVAKLGEASTELAMAAAPGLHPSAFSGRPAIEFPASLKALSEQPARVPVTVPENLPSIPKPLTKEVPRASSEPQATEIHGDLQSRPVEGEGQLPISQSSGGIQPQAGGPAVAGVRGGEPEAPGPEVPLDPLDILKAKRASGEPITAADIDAALRGTAEPPPEAPSPEPVKPPFRPPPPEPARPPRLPGKPVEEPTPEAQAAAPAEPEAPAAKTGEKVSEPTAIRDGDTIRWEPNDKKYSAVEGIVVDVISNTEGERGFNILVPREGDPGNVVRVWENRGKVVSHKPLPVEERPASKAPQTEPEATGAAGGFRRPKTVVEIADEIAARGIDPQASYGQFVKARDLKPEISASEWLPVYRQSLRLAKLKHEAEVTRRAKPAPEPPAPAQTTSGKAVEGTKAQLIEELIGKKPAPGLARSDARVRWDNDYKRYDKLTRSELQDRVTGSREQQRVESGVRAQYEVVSPEISKLAKDAGNKWRTVLKARAEQEGVRFAPPHDSTRGDAVGGLSRAIAEKRAKAQPTGGPAPSPFFPRRSEAQGLGEPALQPTVQDVRRQRAIDQTGVPPPATPEGPGAATPAEFDPTKPFETSIKNAVTAAKRATRGMPAVEEEAARKWGDVWEKVKAEVADDPGAPDRLVASLRDKPRAVTDREDAMLLQQQVSLEEQFNRTTQDMVRLAETDSEAIPEYRIRLAELSDKLLDLYDVDKSVGRETARGLNARKMMADETYSLVRMELAKRAMNDGRPLTDTERANITALKDKIDATQKAFDEHVAKSETRIRELEAQHAADELKVAAMREAKADAASGTVRDLGAERDSIVAGLGQRASTPLRDLRPWIRKLALNLIRSGITERNALINAVHDVLKDIFPTIEQRDTMDAISGYGDFRPLDPEVAKAKLRDLSGQMQNVSKLEDLLGRRALQKTGPERKTLSDEERRLIKLVNEYKKRYGVVVTDPATQLKSALAAVKTRLTNQIKDLEFQIGTGKKIVKGATKVAYDAEAAELLARRDALKAQFDEVFGKPELTDAQRVDMATKALEKSIEDLRQRIATGDIGPRRTVSKTPVTPELESLRQQRDMALEQLQALRDLADPKKTPEEISLAALKTRLLNANFELHRRIREGDFSKRVRKSVALDPEAQRLKAENLKLRENFQRDLLKDRLAKRTKWEVAQDTLIKLRRAQLLSSPVTLAKLTAAAVQRMIFSPIEEAIGAGLGRIPGVSEVARRAPVEGGFSAAAEAKAIRSALTTGMRDAAQTLSKAGKSQLEVLHGGRAPESGFKESSLMPNHWLDWFGQLHGALKAPVKRAAFERALQKQIEFGIRNGIDVTDPMTIASYQVQAYKAGQRSIFLQDNILVSKINAFLSTRIDPRTGHPTGASKAISTAGRVLLPIVRVPTNIVAETMQYATGLATGNVRLARALRRGVETLPPEEADLIMRHLKKGSIGLAFLTAGYLLPEFIGGYYQPHEKRAKGDVKIGDVRVPGLTVPKLVGGPDVPKYTMHNPLLETLQLGSTVRRVADSSLTKRQPEDQGISAGVVAGVLGLTEEVPAVREMLELTKAFDTRERGAFFGELTKSLVVPQAVQWLARQMDKDTEGEVIPRKPGTVLEHIETGIPGLRESVPEPKRSR